MIVNAERSNLKHTRASLVKKFRKCIIPVSYTHLDVYKRQHHCSRPALRDVIIRLTVPRWASVNFTSARSRSHWSISSRGWFYEPRVGNFRHPKTTWREKFYTLAILLGVVSFCLASFARVDGVACTLGVTQTEFSELHCVPLQHLALTGMPLHSLLSKTVLCMGIAALGTYTFKYI